MADGSVSVPMTLSDLERRDARGQNFRADFHNYAQTVDLKRRNTVKHVEQERVSGVSAA